MRYHRQLGWRLGGTYDWALPPGTRQRDIDRVWEAPDENDDDECRCGHVRARHVPGCTGLACLCWAFELPTYEPDPDEERDES
jgi:hypothetical protein